MRSFKCVHAFTTHACLAADGTGREEEVRGPGVIGKYPEMYPGAFFQYASCCPIPTRTGSMRGTFEARVLLRVRVCAHSSLTPCCSDDV